MLLGGLALLFTGAPPWAHTVRMAKRRTGSRIGPRAAVKYVAVIAPLFVLFAAAGFATLEKDTVQSYWEGLWWALSLMTTVGFVGESPETTGGRIVSSVLMISGFALLALATAAIASLFVREEEGPGERLQREFEGAALERLEQLSVRLEVIEGKLASETEPERPAS
jgi:voltage-gated potassium channel